MAAMCSCRTRPVRWAGQVKLVVDLHADRARLIGRVARDLRDVELEAGVVRRDQRDFVGEVVTTDATSCRAQADAALPRVYAGNLYPK